jgi:phage terminase small subunit
LTDPFVGDSLLYMSASKSPLSLDSRAQLWALEYLSCRNKREAARRCGVPEGNIDLQANKWARDPDVQSFIRERQREAEREAEIRLADVIRELRDILQTDIGLAMDPDSGAIRNIDDWPEGLRKAVKSIKVRETFETIDGTKIWTGQIKDVSFWSKTDAANMLLKRLGAYAPEKVEHSVTLASLVGATQAPAAKPEADAIPESIASALPED